MAYHSEKALVLRRFPFGESSLIVHILTENGRRQNCMARGAFRSKSRLFATLDLFDTLEVQLAERPRSALVELRAATITTRRQRITRDLSRYRAAHAGLELVQHATREQSHDSRIFTALDDLFDHLDEPGSTPSIEIMAFDLSLLSFLGLAPALSRCATCGEPAPPIKSDLAAFSASAGGRLCPNCAARERATGRRVGTLPLAVLAGAELLASLPAQKRALLPPPPDNLLPELKHFIDRFLEYHLETRLRARITPS